ncbi:hypothetical protein [Massilia sp. Leaf139]|uniref:hypothetical protein n=1 Tax=Massilia sp. Leaf139 TaxID=1736272 RepID=UPI00071547D5|nr:hypothetical protein [Massilia sp. Leaf139]KQQ96998.1 hypothetical protein ASF77_03240 [Massilia sp. Leaf139]
MRRILGLIAASIFALPASAACPAADRLVSEYGISFSGFKKQIPKVARPIERGTRIDDLRVLRLPNPKGHVPDGFTHAAVINKATMQAWIRRRGGFVYVEEWYGPMELRQRDMTACTLEPYR